MAGTERIAALWSRLDRAWEEALAPWKGPGPEFTLLFSGGVDSALLAWELRSTGRCRALTVGLPNAPDLAAARQAATTIGLAWDAVALDPAGLELLAREVSGHLDRAPPPSRSIFLALAAGLRACPTTQVVCGQGPDELFLGYAHFRGLAEDQAGRRADEDLHRLLHVDWPMTRSIAGTWAREVTAPYLAPGFLAAAAAVPLRARLPTEEPKGFFRAWARHRGLPEELAGRPKRAFQYGSGVHRWWRSVDRVPDSSVHAGAGLASEGTRERRNVGDHEPSAPG